MRGDYVGSLLPIKNRREELGNQAFIVRPEGLGVNRVIALAVQVVGVERANRSKGELVLFVCEVRVRALSVPSLRREGGSVTTNAPEKRGHLRVKAMIADH